MATGNYVQWKGYDAAAAILKFRAAKFTALETVTAVVANSDLVAGVEQFGVSALEITKGKGAAIATMGDSEWECSAAIAAGALVSIAADGRCKTAVATERVHGLCIEPTTAAGQRARVRLALNGAIA